MAVKKTVPQFELPTAGEVFNLVLESTQDGERLRREAEAAARDTETAQQLEQEQQPDLF